MVALGIYMIQVYNFRNVAPQAGARFSHRMRKRMEGELYVVTCIELGYGTSQVLQPILARYLRVHVHVHVHTDSDNLPIVRRSRDTKKKRSQNNNIFFN